MNNLYLRIISGIVYALLIFLCTHFIGTHFLEEIHDKLSPKNIFIVLMLIFEILCVIELVKMLKFDTILFKIITVFVCLLPFYYLAYGNMSVGFTYSKLLFVAPFLIALITIFRFPEELDSIDTSKLIFVVCYLGIPFALTLGVQNFASLYPSEIFYVFLLIWISDSAAYFVGKKLGKTPLAPKISPKKSREGLFGGIVFTLIAGIFIELSCGYLKGNWIVIALIISIFAPLGDLAASKLKRQFGVKDSGKLFPGHGGFLDRLDSFIGCVPIIYLYFLLLNF